MASLVLRQIAGSPQQAPADQSGPASQPRDPALSVPPATNPTANSDLKSPPRSCEAAMPVPQEYLRPHSRRFARDQVDLPRSSEIDRSTLARVRPTHGH